MHTRAYEHMLDKCEIQVCEKARNVMIQQLVTRGYDEEAASVICTPLEQLVCTSTWMQHTLSAYRGLVRMEKLARLAARSARTSEQALEHWQAPASTQADTHPRADTHEREK